jgi:hypothetical protein
MATNKLTEALNTLTAARAEAAELASKLDAVNKAAKAAEATLFGAVKALGEPQVIDGLVISIKVESKVKNAALGYKELVTAIGKYDAKMGEEAALLAETALEDKKAYNAAHPEVVESLQIAKLDSSWANTSPAANAEPVLKSVKAA